MKTSTISLCFENFLNLGRPTINPVMLKIGFHLSAVVNTLIEQFSAFY